MAAPLAHRYEKALNSRSQWSPKAEHECCPLGVMATKVVTHSIRPIATGAWGGPPWVACAPPWTLHGSPHEKARTTTSATHPQAGVLATALHSMCAKREMQGLGSSANLRPSNLHIKISIIGRVVNSFCSISNVAFGQQVKPSFSGGCKFWLTVFVTSFFLLGIMYCLRPLVTDRNRSKKTTQEQRSC